MKWRASYLKGMESLQRKASSYRGGGNLDSEVFRFKEEWFRKYWLCCCLVEFCCNDLNNYNCTDVAQKQGVCTGVCWGGEAEVEAEIAAQLLRELVEHTSVDEMGWEEWICPLVFLASTFPRVCVCFSRAGGLQCNLYFRMNFGDYVVFPGRGTGTHRVRQSIISSCPLLCY